MSGPPRVKSMNFTETEARPVLGPAGNKARSMDLRKPVTKLKSEKMQKPLEVDGIKGKKSPLEMMAEKLPSPVSFRKNDSSAASILRLRQPNSSMDASCSSDASTDSSHSRASSCRSSRRSGYSTPPLRRRQQCGSKCVKDENKEAQGNNVGGESDGVAVDGAVVKKRCAWVTSNTDPIYTAFHDEDWGLPVHEDRKLFELLSFATALAELTWPDILRKRHIFRDVFLEFDPFAVSKLNEKKIATPGSLANSLLSEIKLRSIFENARQICKIIDEIGSFDKFIWGFVNYKPIVGNFRYPRQVPIKTSKAESISKDLVRRGFRGVGPTVIYSFMQVAGMTNDHLISCFRHQDCIAQSELMDTNIEIIPSTNEGKTLADVLELELVRDIDDLCLSR